MSSKILKKICIEVPEDLVQAIQNARKAGKRYKGDLYSNPLAYAVGALVLLGTAGKKEETLKERLKNIGIERNLLNSEERLILEDLEGIEAEKKTKLDYDIKRQQEIELLADKILEYWDDIAFFNKKNCITYIVSSFEGKLTKSRVEAIFPSVYEPAPSPEKALTIAAGLLYYDGDGCSE